MTKSPDIKRPDIKSPDPALTDALAKTGEAIESVLETLLAPSLAETGPNAAPVRLLAAMRYAVLGGGKRLRPFLVAQTAALFGVPEGRALRAGAALELVHGYSLVHDDLPAMDDDDMRRAKPTTHIAFDEATAILAGDALLTLAFETVADEATHPDPAIRIALTRQLAEASGLRGMCGGQMLDLEAEGRFGSTVGARDEAHVRRVQAMKTGALFGFACEAGAILGKADEEARTALARYADAFGYAFQIADDVLDATASAEEMGKATAKDGDAGKATLIDLLGLDGARRRLDETVEAANAALVGFGAEADTLRALTLHVRDRRS
ncbi:MAG: polyprenyl synthetase family protein [Pseudomonadota bacterium]